MVALKRKARKEGGLAFPGDELQAKPGRPKKSPLKGRTLNAMPVPPGPWWWEDPESPVWDNHHLLPSLSEKSHGSMAAIGPHDVKTYRTMELAAARHGMTMRDYIARRLDIVHRVEVRGEKPTDVALDTRMSTYKVYDLLTKIGRGRMHTYAERAKAMVEFNAADGLGAKVVPTYPATAERPPTAAPVALAGEEIPDPPPLNQNPRAGSEAGGQEAGRRPVGLP